jgi:hypothetical protein
LSIAAELNANLKMRRSYWLNRYETVVQYNPDQTTQKDASARSRTVNYISASVQQNVDQRRQVPLTACNAPFFGPRKGVLLVRYSTALKADQLCLQRPLLVLLVCYYTALKADQLCLLRPLLLVVSFPLMVLQLLPGTLRINDNMTKYIEETDPTVL